MKSCAKNNTYATYRTCKYDHIMKPADKTVSLAIRVTGTPVAFRVFLKP